jgi:SHAQKYF class myb-like DNA-binding protein
MADAHPSGGHHGDLEAFAAAAIESLRSGEPRDVALFRPPPPPAGRPAGDPGAAAPRTLPRGHGRGYRARADGYADAAGAAAGDPAAGAFVDGRLRWTPRLHGAFVRAVGALGGAAAAKPRDVVRAMGVASLSIGQVSSAASLVGQSKQKTS